jgi:hypothetical protein
MGKLANFKSVILLINKKEFKMTTTFSQTVFSPWLTPIRLVSTSNVAGTYSNGNNGVGATLTVAASSLTVDSVVAEVGDRILLQAQTNAYENGIYVVNSIGATVVLQRAADQQSIEQMSPGQYASCGAGAINAGNIFSIIEPLPAILGVDDLVWSADPSAGAVSFSGPASTANALAVFSDTAGNIKAQSTASTLGFGLTISTGNFAVSAGTITSSGAIQATAGNVTAGSSTNAASLISFPASAANGTFIISALNAGGAFNTTLRNSVMGQASVISLPDPGAATANVLLDTGTGATATITKISTGATPVPMVDPGSCTISGVAGAANVCTITIQLKDGAGVNIARQVPFRIYSSSAADGLTLQSAASTGYSVASGGLSLANGTAVTTQISAMSSATGGCVLSLTDTGKLTSYLILVLDNGIKISAQLSAGSYG